MVVNSGINEKWMQKRRLKSGNNFRIELLDKKIFSSTLLVSLAGVTIKWLIKKLK